MAKTNTTSWANRTKEALAEVAVPKAGLRAVGTNFEEITTYYSFSVPKKEGKGKHYPAGTEILGTYQGSFTDKTYGKVTHKVKTDAGLVGLPGCAQLNKLLEQVADGATVQVIYRGKNEIQSGKYAGKHAHSFIVNADKFKNE